MATTRLLPLAMDAAVVRFRKLMAETIAAERGERASRVELPQPARDERDARSIA